MAIHCCSYLYAAKKRPSLGHILLNSQINGKHIIIPNHFKIEHIQLYHLGQRAKVVTIPVCGKVYPFITVNANRKSFCFCAYSRDFISEIFWNYSYFNLNKCIVLGWIRHRNNTMYILVHNNNNTTIVNLNMINSLKMKCWSCILTRIKFYQQPVE